LDNPSLKESITETAFVRLTEKFSEALSVQSTVDLFRSICLERQ